MRHPLVALARKLDWAFIEKTFGEIYSDGPGQPPRPTRLTAGLIILKCAHDLSDEVLCASTGEESEDLFSSACFEVECIGMGMAHRARLRRQGLPRPQRATPITSSGALSRVRGGGSPRRSRCAGVPAVEPVIGHVKAEGRWP